MMDDAELRRVLIKAFLPYAKAFAGDPGAVELRVSLTRTQIRATVLYARRDFDLITASSVVEPDLDTAFRALAEWHDDGRFASLVVDEQSA